MNYNDYEMQGDVSRQWEQSLAFPVLMRKVYLWMTLALAITGITAYGVANSPALLQIVFSNQMVFWGLMIAEIAIVIGVTSAIRRLSLTTATLMFIIYSVLNGVVFSCIFLVYTAATLTSAFLVTAGTFGAMALLGYTTKKDLSGFGRFLLMSLIGIIIATLVNMFFLKSTGLDLFVNYFAVLIFAGLTAYDSQKIKMMLLQAPDAGETAQKIALLGALSLYLDFINLFLYILRLFGRRD